MDNKLMLNGEKVFLSGVNQAWYTYGADFGKSFYNKSKPHLLHTLDAIHKSGGNSIRIWLHVDGQNTPLFDSSGLVIGLDGNMSHDLSDFLEAARQRNVLVTLSLWNGAVMDKGSHLYGLIMNDSKLESYIENALVPMVQALKSARSLALWEIMNEPEGCIRMEQPNLTQPCYDTSSVHVYDMADWTHTGIPLERILKFIARQAAAIHTEDPKALVTVGSWEYKTVTNRLGRRNFYSDTCLQYAAGGLSEARLNVYQIHTYDFLFFYLPGDPFLVDAGLYNVDKPLIIGEFSQKKGGMMTSQEQFTWAYNHGYSGAWSWSADSASDALEVQERGMMSLKDMNDQSKGGRVNIILQTHWEHFLEIIQAFLLTLNEILPYI